MTDLFGALDIQDISEVPDSGTYPFVLKVVRDFTSNAGNTFVVFEFILDDPLSTYNGHKVDKFMRVYPGLTQDELEGMEPEDKTRLIKNVNQYKAFLRRLNVPEDELGSIDPKELTGQRIQGYGFPRDRRDGDGKEWVLWDIKAE